MPVEDLDINAVAVAIMERLTLENEVGCIPDGWEAFVIVHIDLALINIRFARTDCD